MRPESRKGIRFGTAGTVTRMAPATLTPPRVRTRRGTGSGLGRAWRVIVLNDNHNTFDGVAFAAGEEWRCVVKPQLPYTLEFVIALDEVYAGESARARLTGELRGWAVLTLLDDGPNSRLRLQSDLTADSGVARVVGRRATKGTPARMMGSLRRSWPGPAAR